jgi:hypothetical protein
MYFSSAINRLADRRNLTVLRIDVEDGKPSLVLAMKVNAMSITMNCPHPAAYPPNKPRKVAEHGA